MLAVSISSSSRSGRSKVCCHSGSSVAQSLMMCGARQSGYRWVGVSRHGLRRTSETVRLSSTRTWHPGPQSHRTSEGTTLGFGVGSNPLASRSPGVPWSSCCPAGDTWQPYGHDMPQPPARVGSTVSQNPLEKNCTRTRVVTVVDGHHNTGFGSLEDFTSIPRDPVVPSQKVLGSLGHHHPSHLSKH